MTALCRNANADVKAALLAGLMYTDGSAIRSSTFVFHSLSVLWLQSEPVLKSWQVRACSSTAPPVPVHIMSLAAFLYFFFDS